MRRTDDHGPGRAAVRIGELLPAARIVRVAAGDHMMTICEPALLADAVEQLL